MILFYALFHCFEKDIFRFKQNNLCYDLYVKYVFACVVRNHKSQFPKKKVAYALFKNIQKTIMTFYNLGILITA